MKANSNMRALLRDPAFGSELPDLPSDTQDTVEAGWTTGPSGSLLLSALWTPGRQDLPAAEVRGYEYEMNDVDISLDDLGDREGSFLARAASRAFSFASLMLVKAAGLPGSEMLQASVSVSVDVTDQYFALQGANVRFFTRRGDDLGWFDDLEKFKIEAIALLDVSDLPVS